MQLTNMIFSMILVFIMVAGMSLFLVDVSSNYPINSMTANSTASGLFNATYQLNQSISQLSPELNASASKAANTNTQDTGIAAALGYLFGAISSLQILMTMPFITLNFINVLAAMGGVFVPAYIIPMFTVAVMAIMLIGVLYYLLKVK